ncbi:gamma-glutamyl-gamma-aminobutyrate hydrolase family protein [Hydrogenimonas urashimensis]|uniref:gamma-glutamyl-gamma-aminobutyrate hydrolase family protein n=1 Tax=Hydrogenimonas urashimensis TaxID=2740515 RepID=UPI0019157D99|nr:gamma-glutamyl-gamma-aminobutyrate hydrolase family protein [Hydrogenimonas urashimensis]
MSRFLLAFGGLESRFMHPKSWEGRHRLQMDGLLITGGIDIDPETYGGSEHPSIVRSDPKRDAMELALMKRAKEQKVPIMGICRGMQLINLFYGGTLHPHIHDLELDYPHPNTPLPLRTVTIEQQSRLYGIVGTSVLRVNALHHQAVDIIGAGLQKAAHDRNGIVQAIESKEDPFVLGLQWHPEFMPYAWHSRKIFSAFAEAVKGAQ